MNLFKNKKTKKYRGGQVRDLRNKGIPNKSINVTFSGTQEPNPILVRGGPIPPPIIQTSVGGTLLNFIELVKGQLKNAGREADIRLANGAVDICEKMLDYPESSNLENYILLSLFFDTAAIANLISALHQTLRHRKGRYDKEEPYDVTEHFQNPLLPPEVGKIDSRRFFSLMVLSSRMCLKYKLRSNKECELFEKLNELFQGGNGPNFNSASIGRVFNDFIRTNSAFTNDYVKKIIDGERIYEIYRGNYFQADREISKQLITARLNRWLKIVPDEEFIIDVPVSYLFNKFTNREKELMNKNSEICKTISENSDAFGTRAVPTSLLPTSVFNIEQNDNIDFDKINEFLHKLSPAPVQKKIKKQQIKKQQIKKNKTQLLNLDKKGIRGTRKIR